MHTAHGRWSLDARAVDLEVDFKTTAELELWDDDSACSAGKPVEERDNQLLATWSFLITDEPGEDLVVTLSQGPDAKGAVYKMRYSLYLG